MSATEVVAVVPTTVVDADKAAELKAAADKAAAVKQKEEDAKRKAEEDAKRKAEEDAAAAKLAEDEKRKDAAAELKKAADKVEALAPTDDTTKALKLFKEHLTLQEVDVTKKMNEIILKKNTDEQAKLVISLKESITDNSILLDTIKDDLYQYYSNKKKKNDKDTEKNDKDTEKNDKGDVTNEYIKKIQDALNKTLNEKVKINYTDLITANDTLTDKLKEFSSQINNQSDEEKKFELDINNLKNNRIKKDIESFNKNIDKLKTSIKEMEAKVDDKAKTENDDDKNKGTENDDDKNKGTVSTSPPSDPTT